MPNDELWFTEWFTPGEKHSHKIERYLVQEDTPFEKAIIADTTSFGRCLILDKEMQSAELDEYIYHEALVHPAMILHDNPKKALILGGGEGATLREILRYPSIESVWMVDIDGDVVEFCKTHLTQWHQGGFDDPRTHVVIADAKDIVEKGTETFDVIISDLTTPIEGGPAVELYTIEFYQKLKRLLNPGGLFSIQAGSGNLLQIDFHKKLFNTLAHVFPKVSSYFQFVPSFDVPWAFLLCGDIDPLSRSEEEIDQRIERKVQGDLKFYDGLTHHGLFRIPKHIRTLYAEEKETISQEKPCHFFKS